MALSRNWNRNVRPRRNVAEDDDVASEDYEAGERPRAGVDGSASEEEDGRDVEEDENESEDASEGVGEDEDEDEDEEDEEQDPDDADEKIQHQISNISFGALKQAEDSFARKRKRDDGHAEQQEEKLAALRARLDQLRQSKVKSSRSKDDNQQPAPASTRRTKTVTPHDNEDDDAADDTASDSDTSSAPSIEGSSHTRSRTSKHAPTAQSSRYQVSRKRTVVDAPKDTTRDPRFIKTSHSSSHHSQDPTTSNAYSFLTDYRTAEISDLRTSLKNPRLTADEKQLLQNKINSLSNTLKAHSAKRREAEVLREHRRAEREKASAQGKTPYFLKKSAVKEILLREKFDAMKAKDREKLLEKRRRKESQREMKRLPRDRRVAG